MTLAPSLTFTHSSGQQEAYLHAVIATWKNSQPRVNYHGLGTPCGLAAGSSMPLLLLLMLGRSG